VRFVVDDDPQRIQRSNETLFRVFVVGAAVVVLVVIATLIIALYIEFPHLFQNDY
jgi:hypothetical protein